MNLRRWLLISVLSGLLIAPHPISAQTTPYPSFSADSSTALSGGSVTITFANIPNPWEWHWIGLFSSSTAAYNLYLSRIFVGCGTSPTTAAVSGACSYPVNVAPGVYELRFYDATAVRDSMPPEGAVWAKAGLTVVDPNATPTPGAGTPTVTPGPATATPTVTPTPPPAPTPIPVSLFYSQSVTSPQATFRFALPGLPVRILIAARSTYVHQIGEVAAVSLGLRFNDDAAANYSWANTIMDGTGTRTIVPANGGGDELRMRVGWVPDATAPQDSWGSYQVDLLAPNQAIWYGGASLAITKQLAFQGWGAHYNNGPTTVVTIMQDTLGMFDIGSNVMAWRL